MYAVVDPATGETIKEYPTIADDELRDAVARADLGHRMVESCDWRPSRARWLVGSSPSCPRHESRAREDHLVVRSPGNPRPLLRSNFVFFADPPRDGDGSRWEALFAGIIRVIVPPADSRTFARDLTTATGLVKHAASSRSAEAWTRCSSTPLPAAPTLQPHTRQTASYPVRALERPRAPARSPGMRWRSCRCRDGKAGHERTRTGLSPPAARRPPSPVRDAAPRITSRSGVRRER